MTELTEDAAALKALTMMKRVGESLQRALATLPDLQVVDPATGHVWGGPQIDKFLDTMNGSNDAAISHLSDLIDRTGPAVEAAFDFEIDDEGTDADGAKLLAFEIEPGDTEIAEKPENLFDFDFDEDDARS